jgi:hypothetical protein
MKEELNSHSHIITTLPTTQHAPTNQLPIPMSIHFGYIDNGILNANKKRVLEHRIWILNN